MIQSKLEFLKAIVRGRFHRKFKGTINSLRPLLGENGVVFDVGGNQGRFAKEFARPDGGGCRVHVFEPFADNLKLCRINLASFKNVTIHPIALSDQNTVAELVIPLTPEGLPDSATPFIGKDVGNSGKGPKGGGLHRITIDCRRLDDVVKSESLPAPSFIKIDVEGHATKMIRGAMATIEQHRPNLLIELSQAMEERSGGNTQWILSYLKGLGYSADSFDIPTGRKALVTDNGGSHLADVLFSQRR